MSQPDHYLNNEQLLSVFDLTKTATAIHVGETAVIQTANDAMLAIWGKDRSVIGKSLEEALPELKGQPFIDMFRQVWLEGLTISGTDAPADLVVNGEIQTLYFDFEYRAIKNDHGETICILHSAIDVTDRFLRREALERAEEKAAALVREQILNEELASANEELGAINEELQQTQESLNAINNELEERVARRVAELTESEARFKVMAEGTDILIAVGDETGNAVYFNDAWIRLTGRSMKDLLEFGWVDLIHPDDRDRIVTTFTEAFTRKKPFKWEFRILSRNGEYRWLLAQGPPRFRPDGSFAGYISSCVDITDRRVLEEALNLDREELQAMNEEIAASNEEIAASNEELSATNEELLSTQLELEVSLTEHMTALKKLEQAEEMLRFSVEAANAATWYLGAESRTFIVSDRLKEIFGYEPDRDLTYDDVLNAIPEEYQEKIHTGVQSAVEKGETYNMEHPVLGNDGTKKWVRALGKLYPGDGERESHFSGLIIDITEQKQDELRKNDFIGMVSHELKTPLTTLTAIVQMLGLKLKNNPDEFIPRAVDKANIQVKKMSNMINGFLNVSRLESGKIQIVKSEFDLNELVEEMISEIKLSVSHVIISKPCNNILLNADRDKIGSVISNLLSNAVKYSSKDNVIEVDCSVQKNQVQISVKDKGLGVKPEDLHKLFDRYYRVEDSNTRHISGFGIGLYLSAEIIHRHNGTIWAESEFGQGSTFGFTLPLK